MIKTDIKMKVLEPETNVVHLVFENQRDLAQGMMRLQEHYEGASEDLRGKYFTLEQFLHHFTDKHGDFSYTSVWCGFNVPGNVVDHWRALFNHHDGLTHKERQVMWAIDGVRRGKTGKWYLIANAGKPDGPISRHELAHARYHLNDDYKQACDALIDQLVPADRNRICRLLLKMGYTEAVISDEIQAYLSTSSKADIIDKFGILCQDSEKVIRKFRKLFRSWKP